MSESCNFRSCRCPFVLLVIVLVVSAANLIVSAFSVCRCEVACEPAQNGKIEILVHGEVPVIGRIEVAGEVDNHIDVKCPGDTKPAPKPATCCK